MQFRDLKTQYIKYKKEIDEAVEKVFIESNFISGPQVVELEKRLAEYVGVKHCISCANGTDALSLVLTAWGIGKGDAVFVPNFTFFATAEVVSFVGATPIFVDVDAKTFNINPKELEKKIKQVIKEGKFKPKVIIPVDLFGLLADYETISAIAKKYNLLILEDGAQGFGAEYKGKRACSFGNAAITSFFPAKPLGCYGDGGAIFTNDDNLTSLLESLRVHGKGEDKYDNIRIGVNSRLDTVQAAILNVKMTAFINHELNDVNIVFKKYNDRLKKHVEIPFIPEGYLSSFAQYTIKLKNKQQRDELKNFLSSYGIPSMIYYTKTMHNQTAFKDFNCSNKDYPISTSLCDIVLSLPMHPYLTEEDIDFVSDKIIEFLLIK
ncbi:MAG TPA: DegT/DnrJ/EryC1/StrS family aminotransferase [Bacilli bacterium]|nr:MAG: UDP-2-acetamido-2-deoxy-3-oxo-D-glucuronate aminotransferase [Tenericutes bacterium ADurb.BinA124]HPX84715.1 DegT/DnrJ/EryC1/StrS family aminotransferase [Bacilli bacterium]